MLNLEEELYRKILNHLKPRSLCWIINDLMTKRDLLSIANKSGLYNGKGGDGISPDVIATDISNEYFKKPYIGKIVTKFLLNKKLKEKNKLSQMDSINIKKYIGDGKNIFKENRVGKVLWAITTDDRSDVNAQAAEFTEKIEKIIDSLNSKTNNKPFPQKDVQEKEIKEIKKTSEEQKFEEQKVKKYSRVRKEPLKPLQNEKQKLLQELEEAKKSIAEYEKIEKEKKLLEKEVKKLYQDFGELTRKNQDEVKSLGLLERENLQLRGEIARWEIKFRKIQKNYSTDNYWERDYFLTSNPRVGVFIDVQNIYYGAKIGYQAKLDFQKLLNVLTRDRQLISAIAYIVQTPEINQDEFIRTLDRVGYKVKSKDLRRRADGSAKGDWDLGIAMDIISLQDKLDVIVLVSGDGDFIELIKVLKKNNITVEIAAFQHNTSKDLIEIADTFYPLEEDMVI